MNAMFLVVSLLVGVLLGGFYFGGLWLTVRRLPDSATAGLWLLGSFVLRTAVVLFGFFVVSDGRWERIVACLVGFLLARTVILRVSVGTSYAGSVSRELPLVSGSAGASPSHNEGSQNGHR